MDIAAVLAVILGGLLGIIIVIPIIGGVLWLQWKIFVFIARLGGSAEERGTLLIGFIASIVLGILSEILIGSGDSSMLVITLSFVVEGGIISLIVTKTVSWRFIFLYILYAIFTTFVSAGLLTLVGIDTV